MAILKLGATGPEVTSLQNSLIKLGYQIKADGSFGAGTLVAVRNFQQYHNLTVDGIVGPQTLGIMVTLAALPAAKLVPASGRNNTLTPQDFVDAAASLGAEVAAVKSVCQVESLGGGFTKDGYIKVLFERHIMYRQLIKNRGQVFADAAAAATPSLVSKTAGGYSGGVAENQRLLLAIEIDEQSAFESASYGMFQIMGFNATLTGHDTAKQMYTDFLNGEREQLLAFVGFIKSNPNLWKAIKAKDWAAFAKGYNGSNYAINKYDSKLKAAYDALS